MNAAIQLTLAFLLIVAIVATLIVAERKRAKRAREALTGRFLDARLAEVRRAYGISPATNRNVEPIASACSSELDLIEQSRNLDAVVKAARDGMHNFS